MNKQEWACYLALAYGQPPPSREYGNRLVYLKQCLNTPTLMDYADWFIQQYPDQVAGSRYLGQTVIQKTTLDTIAEYNATHE